MEKPQYYPKLPVEEILVIQKDYLFKILKIYIKKIPDYERCKCSWRLDNKIVSFNKSPICVYDF